MFKANNNQYNFEICFVYLAEPWSLIRDKLPAQKNYIKNLN